MAQVTNHTFHTVTMKLNAMTSMIVLAISDSASCQNQGHTWKALNDFVPVAGISDIRLDQLMYIDPLQDTILGVAITPWAIRQMIFTAAPLLFMETPRSP